MRTLRDPGRPGDEEQPYEMPTENLLTALLAADGTPRPAEILLGRLTAPERLHGPPDPRYTQDKCVAVLFWRSRLYVLAYDYSGDNGCPACLSSFVTRQQVPRHAPLDTDTAQGTDHAVLWQRIGPALQAVVARIAASLMEDRHPAGTLATIERASCAVQYGRVPPRSGCPVCTPRMAASAVSFDSGPELLLKADGTLRSRRALPSTLTSDYVGAHSLFREPLLDLDGPVPAAQIGMPLNSGDLEPGIGRTLDFSKSRVTAVLEGLERYTGFHYRADDGVVEASLAELGERAIDPRTLGYHLDAHYAQEDFPFAPLQADENIRWAEVTPLGDGPARYLPEMALSWVTRSASRKPLFYDTSNGFALGQSPEEATLHGILEIVERDAFLLTWYRRLLLPELTLGPADREVRDLVERVEIITGFRIRLYWAALDTGLPVVVALAQRDATSGPCTFVSAGASLYPRAAAASAILEVSAILAAITHSFEENREHGERLATDFGSVRTMSDHSLLGALPTSRKWFDFLTTRDRPDISLTEVSDASPVFATLREDLDHVRERIEAVGSVVYAADVTTPELRWRGLVCARAFVPGFLPMTFGHSTRRMEGLPRLHGDTLPHASLLAPGQSPVDVPPHPFP
ncbi:YcaO-like family protein [Streptomyces sp. NPDC002004]